MNFCHSLRRGFPVKWVFYFDVKLFTGFRCLKLKVWLGYWIKTVAQAFCNNIECGREKLQKKLWREFVANNAQGRSIEKFAVLLEHLGWAGGQVQLFKICWDKCVLQCDIFSLGWNVSSLFCSKNNMWRQSFWCCLVEAGAVFFCVKILGLGALIISDFPGNHMVRKGSFVLSAFACLSCFPNHHLNVGQASLCDVKIPTENLLFVASSYQRLMFHNSSTPNHDQHRWELCMVRCQKCF